MYKSIFALIAVLAVSACEGVTVEEEEVSAATIGDKHEPDGRDRERWGTIHGNDDGFLLSDLLKSNNEGELGAPGAARAGGVNRDLWRAAIDTVSFMPLASVDPASGVILTDWYSPVETPSERFKLSVFITSAELRADAVNVAIAKQQRSDLGWNDIQVAEGTTRNFEDQIIERARDLRIAGTR